MQGAARQLAAEVLASLGSHAPSVTLFPALAMMKRDEGVSSSEEMQQVLRPVKAKHGSLLQEAVLLVQYLRDVACLWSEQWMHILRDVQVSASVSLVLPHVRRSHNAHTLLTQESVIHRMPSRTDKPQDSVWQETCSLLCWQQCMGWLMCVSLALSLSRLRLLSTAER